MVLGIGLVINLGITTNTTRIIKGYSANGRTKVPPPIPDGKYGKLVTGKLTKNKTHEILATRETIFSIRLSHLLGITFSVPY